LQQRVIALHVPNRLLEIESNVSRRYAFDLHAVRKVSRHIVHPSLPSQLLI
jgi:hypothetical protein